MVDAAAVSGLPEPPLEAVGRDVEGLVEVFGARLAADHGAARAAGDLDMLTAAGLPGVLLVMQFDVSANDLLVVAFDLGEFVGDVCAVVIRHDDVATPDDDLHATRGCVHATSTLRVRHPVRSPDHTGNDYRADLRLIGQVNQR